MSTGRKSGEDVLGLAAPGHTAVSDRPSIEVARKRLGGQVTGPSERVPGSLVRLPFRGVTPAVGVLLWAGRLHCDVWFEDGVARRTPAALVTPHAGAAPESLLRVAAEMRLFLSLGEGDRVCWERAGSVADGRIVEKCRYGAIVAMADGKVVAVGFRKLWPATVHGKA